MKKCGHLKAMEHVDVIMMGLCMGRRYKHIHEGEKQIIQILHSDK